MAIAMDSTVVEVQASIPARSLIVPIMVLFSNKEKNFLRGYKVCTTNLKIVYFLWPD
mgnify:FL=1